MAKARLLNDGHYGSGLGGLEYPIEVEVVDHLTNRLSVNILGSELIRIGGKSTADSLFGFEPENTYIFFLDTEAELV